MRVSVMTFLMTFLKMGDKFVIKALSQWGFRPPPTVR